MQVIASLQAVEALKILSGQANLVEPVLTVVDVWEGTWRRLKLGDAELRGHCPACQQRGEGRTRRRPLASWQHDAVMRQYPTQPENARFDYCSLS